MAEQITISAAVLTYLVDTIDGLIGAHRATLDATAHLLAESEPFAPDRARHAALTETIRQQRSEALRLELDRAPVLAECRKLLNAGGRG